MIDFTRYETWVPLVGGALVPFFVALLSRVDARGWVKSCLAVLGLGLTSLGVYLANFDGITHTWRGALFAFLIALFTAGASRIAITGGADTRLQAATGSFGVR